MSSLVSGLDNIAKQNTMNIGENSHAQHAWTHADFEHNLVQLYFQLVRIPKYSQEKMQAVTSIYTSLVNSSIKQNNERQINYCMSLLFQTRDICGGKGEYSLFYNMLTAWEPVWESCKHKIQSPLALCFNTTNTDFDKPYGSWKDVKYIVSHWKTHYKVSNEELVSRWQLYPVLSFIVNLSIKQLLQDKTSDSPSLVSRWLPREKSSFGWQVPIYAELLHCLQNQIVPGESIWKTSEKRGFLRTYRKTLGALNKRLNTVQINQAGKTWKNIDFEKHGTSLTMQRQRKAFLCDGQNKMATADPDRIACRSNYLKYVEDCINGKKQMKSKRVSLGEIVKDSFKCHEEGAYKDAINVSWRDHDKPSHLFKDCIAMVDTSASMTWENCPFYDAVGIGLKIAECSTLGKRVMTFSSNPCWVNLSGLDKLTDMVEELGKAQIGMSTNIYKAMNLIAVACLEQDLHPDVVEGLTLVILSDMQIDQADSNWESLDENIKTIFAETGKKSSHEVPYAPPTLIYWNMRNTNGFPCSTTRENVIMVSGYSIDVLNSVFSKGPDALKKMKPWDALSVTLEANRYSWFW